MSANATIDRPDVEAYLAAVRAELADLGSEERDELLADVEASIVESAEESDAPIAARLGPPSDFAAELRAAAGLGVEPSVTKPKPRPSLADLWRDPRTAYARRIAGELAPIWWVARAYVVLAVVAWLSGGGRNVYPYEVYNLGPSRVAGFALLALAVVVSVALGLWQRRARPGRASALVVAANLALAALAVPVYANVLDWIENGSSTVYVVEEAVYPDGLAHDGAQVQNVYGYTRDGRLLLDVLLFDQLGRPLNVRPGATAANDPNRRILRAGNGREILNAYPIRYFEPGTRRVANPLAAPPIWMPQIATAPLPRR